MSDPKLVLSFIVDQLIEFSDQAVNYPHAAEGEVRGMGTTERQKNQDAFRQLRDFIQRTYPPGRFLAISGGQIIADAASFEELDAALYNMGRNSTEILVVQAGVEYPDNVVIFAG